MCSFDQEIATSQPNMTTDFFNILKTHKFELNAQVITHCDYIEKFAAAKDNNERKVAFQLLNELYNLLSQGNNRQDFLESIRCLITFSS
ncbi:hypothetical protein FACS1894113_2870 [Alphaproteobacteria bacterium]|nr:hypothetical protein FACS1894113_2870 [Alphaproteobacteria bacterium]